MSTTPPGQPEADGSSSAWLLASIGAATVIMLFSWFGGFVSWHDAASGPYTDPVLTLSGFKPHGTQPAHAIRTLADRTLCIGPYDVAPWTAARALALGVTLLGSLVSMRLVLRHSASLPRQAAALATTAAAGRMVAWWLVPFTALFVLGGVLPLGLLTRAGIVWGGVMPLAFLPWQVARACKHSAQHGPGRPTFIQFIAGCAWLVVSIQVAGLVAARPAP